MTRMHGPLLPVQGRLASRRGSYTGSVSRWSRRVSPRTVSPSPEWPVVDPAADGELGADGYSSPWTKPNGGERMREEMRCAGRKRKKK